MRKIDRNEYKEYLEFANECIANRVYPISIVTGAQDGDIYTDDKGCVLFWHYCGFAYISGNVSEDILEAIYPEFVDVNNLGEDKFDNDLERFVKSTTNVKNSAYPSLCANLKYGSATSIIVNKAFFVTQTPNFRTYISSIEKCSYMVWPFL